MAAALDSICRREKMRGRERRKERREKERGRCAGPSSHVPGAPSPFQALVVQGGVDGNNLDSSLRPELRRLLKSSEAPRTRGVGRRPQELTPPPEDLLSFAAPSDALNSSVPAHGEQRAKRELLKPKIYSFEVCNCRHKQFCWWSKPSSIVVILVSLHGAAAWRGGQRRTCETTINTSDANTPRWKNCIRQTVYDIVGLDYEKVTVLIDATAAARPDIHLASIRDMRTIGVETPTLEEWRR